jgi:glycosyltransferase involved in cell wall biosynthesis
VPKGPQVLYQGVVPHEDIPEWLSAADIFVLPTLDEGCSNAILEAIFCGLPVISSDLPFNHGILDEQVAILVDPGDEKALGQAIACLLKQPERRAAMSQAALQRTQAFRLADRARSIVTFLRSLC